MKHFEIESWTDFVRGFAEPTLRSRMESHLQSQCEPCAAVVDTLRRFAGTAKREPAYEVPDYAVRSAKAIFALQRPERVQLMPRLVARLVFDSFREPLPAGVRGQTRTSRQTLYEAGSYSIDLRIEQERGERDVMAVGQLFDLSDPQRRMAMVPVILTSGDDIVAKAISNAFGEFQLRYTPARHLRLHMPLLEASAIELDLDSADPATDDSEGSA